MNILVAVDGSDLAFQAACHALQRQRDGLNPMFLRATVQEPTRAFEMMVAPDADVLDRVTGAAEARALRRTEAHTAASAACLRSPGSIRPEITFCLFTARACCELRQESRSRSPSKV